MGNAALVPISRRCSLKVLCCVQFRTTLQSLPAPKPFLVDMAQVKQAQVNKANRFALEGLAMVQTCEYWLPIKKRRCKFEARPGFKFCGNHMPNSLQPEERKRIPCPWDPSQYAAHCSRFKCNQRAVRPISVLLQYSL